MVILLVPGRTRVTDSVSLGSTVITVDTTVGFPTSGSLSLPTASVAGVVTYTGKTSKSICRSRYSCRCFKCR